MENIKEPIIGAQGGLKTVYERVAMVAKTDMPVLLLGETGSGKEVVARAIHESSKRKDKPFIRVNCAAISPTLIDSELFGHEKGSFTGAVASKKGWFERANGGTLFLDEIGEMPESVQVRLLRILQDGTFDRVGSERSSKVDVRVIAATHRDLTSMVKRNEFREDLWYRISTFPIRIPSLRERPEDIQELAAFFLKSAALRFDLKAPPLNDSDLVLMKEYSWPGNVRELEAVIARAVLLGRGQTLEMAKAIGADSSASNVLEFKEKPKSTTLSEVAKAHIEEILSKTCGRIDGPFGAAKILKLHPNTLRSKIKKLGIVVSEFKKLAS